MKISNFVLWAFVALERTHLVHSFWTPQTAKSRVPYFNTDSVVQMTAEKENQSFNRDKYNNDPSSNLPQNYEDLDVQVEPLGFADLVNMTKPSKSMRDNPAAEPAAEPETETSEKVPRMEDVGPEKAIIIPDVIDSAAETSEEGSGNQLDAKNGATDPRTTDPSLVDKIKALLGFVLFLPLLPLAAGLSISGFPRLVNAFETAAKRSRDNMGQKDEKNSAAQGTGNQLDAKNGATDPSLVDNVYAESIAELSTSGLAYAFTDIIDLVRDGNLNLTIPEEFPEKNLTKFLAKSMDFTDYNGGNGISFYEIKRLIEENEEALAKAYEKGYISSFGGRVYQDVQETLALGEYGVDYMKGLFLSFHRSLDQKVACVYSIVKDTNLKRIIVSFRGSRTSRDWEINFRPGTISMSTPEKIRHKLEGSLQEGVDVRTGFYEYLFNNTEMGEGTPQRYDSIRKDMQTLLIGETDYTVYVTGHSLGGSLANLFSFNLAGGGDSEDMLGTESVPIPKPVTCITWAAAFSGSYGFRSAYEHLEREGLLRSIRINNADDPIPTAPPLGNFVYGSRMAHVGINIRLSSSGFRIEHSSRSSFRTALRNSMLKPIWKMVGKRNPHTLQLHCDRFEAHIEEFQAMRLDDLYKNNTIVSQDFIDGNIQ